MYVSITGNYIDLSGEGYIFWGPSHCRLGAHHRYGMAHQGTQGGLRLGHWVTHPSHCVARHSYWSAHRSYCVARLSHWAAHHSHWVARPSHCVARLSHWAAHLSHCAAHHLHGVPTVVLGKYTIVDAISRSAGGYFTHLDLILPTWILLYPLGL
jgi:hypothetical protein